MGIAEQDAIGNRRTADNSRGPSDRPTQARITTGL